MFGLATKKDILELQRDVALLQDHYDAVFRSCKWLTTMIQHRWMLTTQTWLVNLGPGQAQIIKWEPDNQGCKIVLHYQRGNAAVLKRFDGEDAVERAKGWIRCFAQDLGAGVIQ